MTQLNTPALADAAAGATPDFTAEIAAAWAKLRAVDVHDLDRVEAWLKTAMAGYDLAPESYRRSATVDQLPALAPLLYAAGRRPRALAFQRSVFRAGPALPARPAEPTAYCSSELDELTALAARTRAEFEEVLQPRRIADEALGLAERILTSSDDAVPGACRLLRLAIAHATEA